MVICSGLPKLQWMDISQCPFASSFCFYSYDHITHWLGSVIGWASVWCLLRKEVWEYCVWSRMVVACLTIPSFLTVRYRNQHFFGNPLSNVALPPKLFFLCLSANSYLWRILGCSVDIHYYIFEPRVADFKTRILISNHKPLNILCVLHSIHYSDLSV